jgi:hypothetical protein
MCEVPDDQSVTSVTWSKTGEAHAASLSLSLCLSVSLTD